MSIIAISSPRISTVNPENHKLSMNYYLEQNLLLVPELCM